MRTQGCQVGSCTELPPFQENCDGWDHHQLGTSWGAQWGEGWHVKGLQYLADVFGQESKVSPDMAQWPWDRITPG